MAEEAVEHNTKDTTHRIYGEKDYDPKKFIIKIRPEVMDLINQEKKPIYVKFVLGCKLMLFMS